MLPRGEQRAMVLLSMLLLLSIAIRIWVQALPDREPVGLEDFIKESRSIISAMAHADSLSRSTAALSRRNSGSGPVTGRSPLSRGATAQSPVTNHQSPIPNHQSPININTADSAQLLPLPGIGPVFAGRIIKYRELLGGFVRSDQLYEVYGLKDETIEMIMDQIYIDTLGIKKMDINLESAQVFVIDFDAEAGGFVFH